MSKSDEFNTRTLYSASVNDSQTFIDKHMKYMSLYPALNYRQYISNLKLMTRVSKVK